MSNFLRALLIIVSISVISPFAYADEGTIPDKIQDRARLLEIARTQGHVKVLVTFKAPDVLRLTQKAAALKAERSNAGPSTASIQADRALAASIESSAALLSSRLDASNASYSINHRYSTLPMLAINASEAALLELEADANVIRIAEDRKMKVMLDESVPQVEADKAWASGYTGAGWYVAILDTGIRNSHEFFTGKTIIESCFSSEGDCPGGLTEVIDTSGAAAHYPDTYDGWDHGTHVAGIAAGNNGVDRTGVAKDADIIAIQVFSKFPPSECDGLNPCIMALTGDILKGLEHILQISGTYNIASVNMSLGGGFYSDQAACDNDYSEIKSAIDNLRTAGIATVVASGNDGFCTGISAPACISSAVAVGAVTGADVEASFNNWHPEMMDLWAPGVDINSSLGDADNSYGDMSGTSMATPHVAGAWAILKERDPAAPVTSLLSTLATTGLSVTTLCADGGSKGRIKIDPALSLTPPAAPDSLTAASNVVDQTTLSWNDNSDNESGFKIERRSSSDTFFTEVGIVGAGITSFTDTGVIGGTSYVYQVRAFSSILGDSAYSNQAGIVAKALTPGTGSGGGGGCFIATAAYGSYLAPEVEVLKSFRDRHLLTNPVGSAVVDIYYKYSPPLADFIAEHDSLRLMVRLMLSPVIYFIKYFHAVMLLLIVFAIYIIARRSRFNIA
jgi:subtilisin family serine protease